MEKVLVDVNLIFNSLSGRILVLLDNKGKVLKANIDALHLLGYTHAKEVFGQYWDNTFSKSTIDKITFSTLTSSTTGHLNTTVLSSENRQIPLDIQIDVLNIAEEHKGKYYLVTGRKRRDGNWDDMLFNIMKGTEKYFGEDFLQSVTKALAKTLNVDFALIGKLDATGSQPVIKVAAFWKKDRFIHGYEYNLAGSPCEDVVDKHQKLITRNVTKAYPKDIGLVKLGVESYFGTPIFYSNGQPLGILVVMDTKPMDDDPSSAYTLNIFASRIGAEIEWAEARDSIVEKDRKLRSVLNAIPHPIFYKDKDGTYAGVNLAFAEMVNLKEEQILGKSTLGDENHDSTTRYDSELLKTPGRKIYASIIDLKSVERKHYLNTKSSILDKSGEIEGLVGSAIDITGLKAAETDLKASEERYRTLFSTASDAIFMMTKDIFIDCNERTLKMFDCKREDIIGHSPVEFSPETQPNGEPSSKMALDKINDTLRGNSKNFYWKHKTKKGVEFDAQVSLNSFQIGGEKYIQAIVRDVSLQVEESLNLETQKARLEQMYELISASDSSLAEQVTNLLELASSSLKMESGVLSKISGDKYIVTDIYNKGKKVNKGLQLKLQETCCDITYEADRLVAIPNMAESSYKEHLSYKTMKMEAYIGIPYWVNGKRQGTLSFMSPTPITTFKPIDLDFVQMLGQWIGAAIERAEFEQNLLERDALLETMVREIPIDFSVRDANLKMVIQSDLSKKYWGNNEGKDIDFSDVDPVSATKWKAVFKRAVNGEVVKGEDHVKIYGKPYIFYSIASPVMVKGHVSEVIVINIDISNIKETEQKLKEQNEQLTKLNTELDRFVYSASHDLRAPLASLLGLIDLTGRETNSRSTEGYLTLMSKSINTLDRFIADITDYSRNLRLDTRADKIDFQKLITDSFTHVQFMIPGPADFSIEIKGKASFYSDYERLKIIINNLVSNSLRYKAYNIDPYIQFKVKVTKTKVAITIIDNGVGIEEKHINRVFEMFYRANDRNVGSGLGLFIVKETIEKLKGTISISSKLNNGTTVQIELPSLLN